MMYVSQIIMLYTLNLHMLYVNYISIKQEQKKKSMGERNFHLLVSDQGCYLYLWEKMDGANGTFLHPQGTGLKTKAVDSQEGQVVNFFETFFRCTFFIDLRFTLHQFLCSKPLDKLSVASVLLIFGGHVNDSHCSYKSTQGMNIIEGH